MKRLHLNRVSTGPYGTPGVLTADHLGILHTLERPWRDNRPNVSCIPTGVYAVERHVSKRHGECLRIIGGTVGAEPCDLTEGLVVRWGILFHVGNTASEVEGCIAVGLRPGLLGDVPAVLSSRDAMVRLMEWFSYPGGPVQLVVRWVP